MPQVSLQLHRERTGRLLTHLSGANPRSAHAAFADKLKQFAAPDALADFFEVGQPQPVVELEFGAVGTDSMVPSVVSRCSGSLIIENTCCHS